MKTLIQNIIIVHSILLVVSCSMTNDKNTKEATNINCVKIDSLVNERYKWKSGNYFSNKIIPVLEKESGIEANCNKGLYGYQYNDDSLFNVDIAKWREYFKCK